MKLHISELVIQLQLLVNIFLLFSLCLQIISFGKKIVNILVGENAVLDSVGQHVLTGLKVPLESASAGSAVSLLRLRHIRSEIWIGFCKGLGGNIFAKLLVGHDCLTHRIRLDGKTSHRIIDGEL